MTSIALRVVMHGLMVLAPDKTSKATQVTALLVNAIHPTSAECMLVHTPTVSFIASQEECDALQASAGCAMDEDGTCTCSNLSGKEITIEIAPAPSPAGTKLNTVVPEALPSSAEAGDFSYVLNLAKPPFNLTLDHQYLGPNPNGDNLAARMIIPMDLLTTCRLVQRRDGGDYNIHALAPRPLKVEGKSDEMIQAAARLVEAKLDLAPNATVALHFHKFNSTDDHVAHLRARGSDFRIELSNEAKGLDPDDPCDDGIARHFDMFYLLATPTSARHLVPHLRLTKSKPGQDVTRPQAPACEPPTAVAAERPICPLASFAQ